MGLYDRFEFRAQKKSFASGTFKTSDVDAYYSDYEPRGLLSAGQTVSLIAKLLMAINPWLGKICWQTAYIAVKIALHNKKDDRISLRTTLILSLFHLTGFYHFIGENLIERKDFTSDEVYRFYTYAYYYLKEMSPVPDVAEAVLFYNKKYNPKIAEKIPSMKYASLIFLSQSLCKMLESKGGDYDERDFFAYGLYKFNEDYLDVFRALDRRREISRAISDGSYKNELFRWFSNLQFTKDDTRTLLRLLIYVMDFKSTQTVQHTIHAASYAVTLGKYAGCSKQELNELYTAGILHDIGKMSIPISILESPKKNLPSWQYTLIKQHVSETQKILQDGVPQKIQDIAVRHHEKMDGSGYPDRLCAADLTDLQRILTVADIFSALVDKRSYKASYDEEQIKSIIQETVRLGQIDARFCRCILENYGAVQSDCMQVAASLRAPLGLVEIQFQEEMTNIQAI